MATAWYADPINQENKYQTAYLGPGTDTPHYAYDIETPFHTPLTAPIAGTVVKADYQDWGGEIFIQPDNHALPEYYFYHPDEVDVTPGQHVAAGQTIALSGGENPGYPGAEHPASSQYSSGPHTHVGWFTKWVTPAETGETIPYGPDPANLLQAAAGGGSIGTSFDVPTSVYSAVHPIAQSEHVPDAIWETVASVESGFNPTATGDNGTSYGLFQLHQGGQLGSLTALEAYNASTNAQAAMPSIAAAWSSLNSSFDANSLAWWEQFAAASGHPGGAPGQDITDSEAQKLMQAYNQAGGQVAAAFNPLSGADWQKLLDPNKWINAALQPIEANIGQVLMRTGVGLVGVVLVGIGMIEIVNALGDTPAGQTVKQKAGEAAKIAEVAAA